MIILDGKKLSKDILKDIRKTIKSKKLKLKLAAVLVGESEVSKSYINKKKEFCSAVGIDFELLNFSSNITENRLKEKIKKIADDKSITGIVVQLPLPKKINASQILNLIPPGKDIDVLSEVSFKKFLENKLYVFPPVVGAVKYLLEKYKIPLIGKKITLVGSGRLVGRPLSVWLKNEGVDFFVVDKSIDKHATLIKDSDVVISGAGCPCFIKKDMVKDGVVLIDVGTSSEGGMIKGDIDISSYKKASYVAPVPGGVGPLTVAILIENLLKLKP